MVYLSASFNTAFQTLILQFQFSCVLCTKMFKHHQWLKADWLLQADSLNRSFEVTLLIWQ